MAGAVHEDGAWRQRMARERQGVDSPRAPKANAGGGTDNVRVLLKQLEEDEKNLLEVRAQRNLAGGGQPGAKALESPMAWQTSNRASPRRTNDERCIPRVPQGYSANREIAPFLYEHQHQGVTNGADFPKTEFRMPERISDTEIGHFVAAGLTSQQLDEKTLRQNARRPKRRPQVPWMREIEEHDRENPLSYVAVEPLLPEPKRNSESGSAANMQPLPSQRPHRATPDGRRFPSVPRGQDRKATPLASTITRLDRLMLPETQEMRHAFAMDTRMQQPAVIPKPPSSMASSSIASSAGAMARRQYEKKNSGGGGSQSARSNQSSLTRSSRHTRASSARRSGGSSFMKSSTSSHVAHLDDAVRQQAEQLRETQQKLDRLETALVYEQRGRADAQRQLELLSHKLDSERWRHSKSFQKGLTSPGSGDGVLSVNSEERLQRILGPSVPDTNRNIVSPPKNIVY